MVFKKYINNHVHRLIMDILRWEREGGGREKKREMFYLDTVVLSAKAGLRYVKDVLKKSYISISSSELIFK